MHRTAYLLLVLTTLFWGGNAVAGKLAIGHVSPMLLTALRWGVAMVVLWLIGHKQLRIDWQLVRGNLPLLMALGFLGFAVFNIALYSALLYTTAINVSIEQAAMPMLIFAANFLLFRLRVTWLQIVGFVLSITGVALTASHGDPRELLALNVNFGDLLMLIGVIVYSAYTVALRLKPAIHWQSLMIVLTGVAFIGTLPFVAVEFYAGAGIVPDVQGLGVVAYTIFFPSIVAQIFYIKGVEMIGANRAGLFINLVPIFGTLLSVMILRETFHLYHGIAMVLVLGGIWLAEASGRRADAQMPLPVR
ncbi:MAG: DMT family transporter [Alphaproteobacteria bacterium]|nr:DMT family transporter [Alphaproteobacteria bacterium]MBU0805606.1 DMT family transporter [Alphaproteobacteria bacterium]MBU0873552.1 DMT family transporter [Alphaproteobacteria bacterium]MBU1401220.1 DMT family transporter [Alphaproteobacteria bacterium]MBU1592363.1 DMT family transporter [Alphaproteobacteria bacterium]